MTAPRIRCCYKCTKRSEYCHSHCQQYKDESKAVSDFNKKVREEKEKDSLLSRDFYKHHGLY